MIRLLENKMHPLRAAVLAGAIALLLPGCGNNTPPAPVPPDLGQVVLLSDVHFNPFYDPDLFQDLVDTPAEMWATVFRRSGVTDPPGYGKEANYPLLDRALEAAGRETPGTPLLLFPGDILAHKFNETFFALYGQEDLQALRSFVYKTVSFVAGQMRRRFQQVPVVFVLGNNDSYTGDYQLEPGGQFLADTAGEFFDTLLLGAADPQPFLETYRDGGYYAAEPPGSGVVVVCLSTVLFSVNAPDGEAGGSRDAAALRQLDWLEATLADAARRGKKAWVVMHIPPGADIYATVTTYMDETGRISDAACMWKEPYQARFLEIAGRYRDVIQAGFSGHSHMDEFRLPLQEAAEDSWPLVVAPAVSPIFGNNPAFKVLSLAPGTWALLDYRSLNDDLEASVPGFGTFYRFSQAYGTDTPLGPGLNALFQDLASDPGRRLAYTHFYLSGHDAAGKIDETTWPAYWCGIGVMDREAYVECVNGYR